MNSLFHFALNREKKQGVFELDTVNVGITYELDVVLLIQQEVFYLQIPVRQRQKQR